MHGKQEERVSRAAGGAHIILCIYLVLELCDSRGGLPGLSIVTNLLVSVDVKLY